MPFQSCCERDRQPGVRRAEPTYFTCRQPSLWSPVMGRLDVFGRICKETGKQQRGRWTSGMNKERNYEDRWPYCRRIVCWSSITSFGRFGKWNLWSVHWARGWGRADELFVGQGDGLEVSVRAIHVEWNANELRVRDVSLVLWLKTKNENSRWEAGWGLYVHNRKSDWAVVLLLNCS